MPVPDAYKKIQAYDQIRRRPGEVIGDCIVREHCAFREMTEALRRVRNSRPEKQEHDAAVTQSPLEIPLSTRMLNRTCSKTRTLSQRHLGDKNKLVRLSWSWKFGRYRLLQNARLSREERQMVLVGTRNDTEYTAIVTHLRGAWDDQPMTETEEARALEKAARFILSKPTQNGMLNRLRTVSRVMQPS